MKAKTIQLIQDVENSNIDENEKIDKITDIKTEYCKIN